MLNVITTILRQYQCVFAIILGMNLCYANINEANALTGGEILTKLDTDAQYHYVSGILQGLGYARFLRDKPNQAGIKCIQQWLSKDSTARWKIAEQWLEHHGGKPAGTIIYAMVSKECGK